MGKNNIAPILFIILFLIAGMGIYYVHSKKVLKEEKEYNPCHSILYSGDRITYKPQNTSIDTTNGGYWLLTFQERSHENGPLNEKWENIIFNINIDNNTIINCSGKKTTASYFIQKRGIDSPRDFYLCEANSGSARYDKDFGVDGKTDSIDSSIEKEHIPTLENITIAINDENSDGNLDYSDTVYIFRQFYLPGNIIIKIECEQNLIIFCDNGDQLFIVRQRDLEC